MENRGYTGRGVCVAVLDTGIYPHRDFGKRIAAFYDYINHRTMPYDDNGHGTHVCGILAGSGAASGGRYRGIAPGCLLIGMSFGLQWKWQKRRCLESFGLDYL